MCGLASKRLWNPNSVDILGIFFFPTFAIKKDPKQPFGRAFGRFDRKHVVQLPRGVLFLARRSEIFLSAEGLELAAPLRSHRNMSVFVVVGVLNVFRSCRVDIFYFVQSYKFAFICNYWKSVIFLKKIRSFFPPNELRGSTKSVWIFLIFLLFVFIWLWSPMPPRPSPDPNAPVLKADAGSCPNTHSDGSVRSQQNPLEVLLVLPDLNARPLSLAAAS